MIPAFICQEQTVAENGIGPAAKIPEMHGKLLLLTLGITDIVEQESLDVLVKGSTDGETWSDQALRVFPQKFYRGTSAILFDLNQHPSVKFVRAEWIVNRWGVGSKTPMFKFYLHVEVFEDTTSPFYSWVCAP
jgi:hypothetical protein